MAALRFLLNLIFAIFAVGYIDSVINMMRYMGTESLKARQNGLMSLSRWNKKLMEPAARGAARAPKNDAVSRHED